MPVPVTLAKLPVRHETILVSVEVFEQSPHELLEERAPTVGQTRFILSKINDCELSMVSTLHRETDTRRDGWTTSGSPNYVLALSQHLAVNLWSRTSQELSTTTSL